MLLFFKATVYDNLGKPLSILIALGRRVYRAQRRRYATNRLTGNSNDDHETGSSFISVTA